MAEPKGVLIVLTAPDGRVVAHAANFNLDRPGGFKLRDAQEARAHRALASKTIRDFCSPVIADAMDQYECEQVVRRMQDKLGYKKTIIPIGYEE